MEEGARCNELSANAGTGKGGKGAQRRKRGGKEGCGVQVVEYRLWSTIINLLNTTLLCNEFR